MFRSMHDLRLLGIAIRAPWLGFAELDAHTHLLDWGMIFYQRRTANELRSAKKRLNAILARTNPAFIVLVLPGLKANERVPSVRSIVRSLRAAASSRSIQIVPLHRSAIRAAFAPCRVRSKYQIAVALARAFPEVSQKLPPVPKFWEKEDSKMALFDALAGVVAYHKCRLGSASCGKDDPGFS
jgi:hypothetical protein